jgi:hypothetical protein
MESCLAFRSCSLGGGAGLGPLRRRATPQASCARPAAGVRAGHPSRSKRAQAEAAPKGTRMPVLDKLSMSGVDVARMREGAGGAESGGRGAEGGGGERAGGGGGGVEASATSSSAATGSALAPDSSGYSDLFRGSGTSLPEGNAATSEARAAAEAGGGGGGGGDEAVVSAPARVAALAARQAAEHWPLAGHYTRPTFGST